MNEPVTHTRDEGLAKLLGDIVSDGQELFRQQLALLRYELKEDLRKGREAGMLLAFGMGTTFVGSILLAFMLAYLFSWLSPETPLWVCMGAVGGVYTVLGMALCYTGFARLKKAPMLEDSVRTLKENAEWIASPK